MSNEVEPTEQVEEIETPETPEAEATKEEEEYDKVYFSEDDQHSSDTELPEAEAGAEAEPEEPEEAAAAEEEPEEEPEEVAAEPEMVKLVWRGKEIQVTQQEAINMAQQNFDITHKYQEVAKLRKQSENDLSLLDKVRNGDKEALALLAQSGKIDPLDMIDIDLPEIEQGTSNQEEPFLSPGVDMLMQEVVKDEHLYNELAEMEKVLPEAVVKTMAKDPEAFYAIINEVKSGDAALVMPQVQVKLSALDNVDRAVVMSNSDAFANFYVNVKNDMIRQSQPTQPTQPRQVQPQQRSRVNPAEVATRRSNNQKRGEPKQLDSMHSDKAYEAILERLQHSQ